MPTQPHPMSLTSGVSRDFAPPHHTSQEFLTPVARSIEETVHRSGWHQPPISFGILPDEQGELAIAVRNLHGDDPIGSLVGFTAPDDWFAFGVIAEGTTYWLDPSDPDDPNDVGDYPSLARQSSTRPHPHGRVRVTYLVSRTGEVIDGMRTHQGPASFPSVNALRGHPIRPHDSIQPDDFASEAVAADSTGTVAGNPSLVGRVDDICRRVLKLPTLAPTADVREYFACAWLDAVLGSVLEDPSVQLDWRAVASLHIGFGPDARILDHDGVAWSDDLIVRLGDVAARVLPWQTLRRRCAERRHTIEGIPHDDAAWMDTGMFSRFALQMFPPIDVYLSSLADALPGDIFDHITRVLSAWDLPTHYR